MRDATCTLWRAIDDTLPRGCPRHPARRRAPRPPPRPPGSARPDRTQVCLRPVDLEGLLPEEHRARIVWAYVEGLDLTPLYQQIQAVEFMSRFGCLAAVFRILPVG